MGNNVNYNDPKLHNIDFVLILKKLEPIGLLVTVSFAIAALTKDPLLDNRSFEYSVIAGSFFLFSFILGIVKYCLVDKVSDNKSRAYLWLIFPYKFVQFSFYFFFFLGIVFLLLYSYEQVKSNEIIITILKYMFVFFITITYFAVFISKIKEKSLKKNLKFKLIDLGAQLSIFVFFIFGVLQVYDTIDKNANSTQYFLLPTILITGSIFIGLIIIQFIIYLVDILRIEDPVRKKKGLIIFSSAVGVILIPFFILIALIFNTEIINAIQFGMDKIHSFSNQLFDGD